MRQRLEQLTEHAQRVVDHNATQNVLYTQSHYEQHTDAHRQKATSFTEMSDKKSAAVDACAC